MWLLDLCTSPRLRSCAAVSICLLIQAALHAEFYLNEVMPREVQKKSGVAELTYHQRLALEKWLNETFVLKNPQETTKKDESLYLSQNIDHGKKLELSDGSLWEVAPDNVERASFWILPFPLYFVKNNDPLDNNEFPLKLINQNTGLGVKVRQLRPPELRETPPE